MFLEWRIKEAAADVKTAGVCTICVSHWNTAMNNISLLIDSISSNIVLIPNLFMPLSCYIAHGSSYNSCIVLSIHQNKGKHSKPWQTQRYQVFKLDVQTMLMTKK